MCFPLIRWRLHRGSPVPAATSSRASSGHPAAEALTINHGRVLSLIERFPGAPLSFIATKSFVGLRSAEDAVAALTGLNFAKATGPNTYEVTEAGLERVMALRRRAVAFESQKL